MSALARLIDPRSHLRAMPEPDPRCKRYSEPEAIQLHRNHARQVELSRATSTAAGHPSPDGNRSSPARPAATSFNTPV